MVVFGGIQNSMVQLGGNQAATALQRWNHPMISHSFRLVNDDVLAMY